MDRKNVSVIEAGATIARTAALQAQLSEANERAVGLQNDLIKAVQDAKEAEEAKSRFLSQHCCTLIHTHSLFCRWLELVTQDHSGEDIVYVRIGRR